MTLKSLLVISLVLLLGLTLGTNTSAPGLGLLSGFSPPISELQSSWRGRSTKIAFSCLSFNPRIPLSLPIILPTTRPSFRSAFSFASLFNNTTALVSGIFGLSAVEWDFRSPISWAYSFKNFLRKYSLLLYFFVRISSALTLSLRLLSQDLYPRLGLVSLFVKYLG